MDCFGSAYRTKFNIDMLVRSIQLKKPSTEHSQWIPLPKCLVSGTTLTTFCGHTLVVSLSRIFELLEGQWVRIGNLLTPTCYCIVCVMCDQMVVVGGRAAHSPTSTDAVHAAIIV